MGSETIGQAFDPASFEHVPVLLNECLDGLKIDPCIPHTMDGFTLRRVWRGATYEIVVENPDHLEKGVKAMTVDASFLLLRRLTL